MRRIFALLLIATSGWLLYQTATDQLGGVDHLLTQAALAQSDNPRFMFPAVGGLLGLLGGLTVFFGGPGGAMLALIGAVAVSGFALTLKETFELDHFLDNEMAVGVTMLMLAAMAGSMTRVTRRDREAAAQISAERTYSSGRRIY